MILTDDGNNYVCLVEHKQFTNLEELKAILLELEYNFDALEGDESTADPTDEDMWISADGEEIPAENDEASDETVAEDENYKIFKTAEVSHESNFLGDTYHFSVTTMAHEMNTDDLALLGMSGSNLYKLVVAVTMPGKLSAEGAQLTENTASFTITDLEQEQILNVESATTNTTGMIAVGIAILVLIVILILVFSRKKPQQNREFE